MATFRSFTYLDLQRFDELATLNSSPIQADRKRAQREYDRFVAQWRGPVLDWAWTLIKDGMISRDAFDRAKESKEAEATSGKTASV